MKKDNYLYIILHHPRTGGESLTAFLEKNLLPEETLRVDAKELSDKSHEEKKKIKFLAGHTTYLGIHKLIPSKKPRYITILRDPSLMLASLYNSRMMDFPKNKKQSFEKWYSLRKRNEMVLFFDEIFRSTEKKVVMSHKIRRKLREKILDKLDKSKRLHTFMKKLRKKKMSPKEGKTKLQNAKKLLDKCWFIGITENLDKDFHVTDNLRSDLKFLLKNMGVKVDWEDYEIKSGIPGELSILNEKMRQKIYRENSLDLELYNYALKLNREKKKRLRNLP